MKQNFVIIKLCTVVIYSRKLNFFNGIAENRTMATSGVMTLVEDVLIINVNINMMADSRIMYEKYCTAL
jgi:hypothetical protein